MTERWADICFGNGVYAGRIPVAVARGLGIDVTERPKAITVQQRRLMQAHTSFVPASRARDEGS